MGGRGDPVQVTRVLPILSASLVNLELSFNVIFSQYECKNGTFAYKINHSHHTLGWNLFFSLTGKMTRLLHGQELRWNCKPFILMLSWHSFHTRMHRAADTSLENGME